jgi:hypothetical protein
MGICAARMHIHSFFMHICADLWVFVHESVEISFTALYIKSSQTHQKSLQQRIPIYITQNLWVLQAETTHYACSINAYLEDKWLDSIVF